MSFLDSLAQANSTEPAVPSTPQCSRKGCRTVAVWKLLWNNPRIHSDEYRKVWLACAEHREWLEDYLSLRQLLRDVVPFDETTDAVASERNEQERPGT